MATLAIMVKLLPGKAVADVFADKLKMRDTYTLKFI